MSELTKQGKKPISSKPKPSRFAGSFGRRKLDLSPEQEAELLSLGLEGHWIDKARYVSDGNFHHNEWVPFNKNKYPDLKSFKDTQDFLAGTDPAGYVRRGSVVLAVRPIELGDEHRSMLKLKTERLSKKANNSQKAAELKQLIKDSNLDSKTFEGYEENE